MTTTPTDIFVSVGSNGSEEQEAFVAAIFSRLRIEGMNPRTLGRTEWNSKAPLEPIKSIIDECAGAVIIALERTYFPQGVERRGHAKDERILTEVRLPTPWNQIEAALAYGKGLPLLMIVEKNLAKEGLLEAKYDWYVQSVPIDTSSLNSDEFNGILAHWKSEVSSQEVEPKLKKKFDPSSMTIGELISLMRPKHLWSAVVAVVAALGTAFALGAKLFSQ